MDSPQTGRELPQVLEEILGYLNFSSGAADPKFYRNFNELFRGIERCQKESTNGWQLAFDQLLARLNELKGHSPAFRDAEQAGAVLRLALEQFLPAYREFHRDLLFHQPPGALERPFALAKACACVLAEGGPWDDDTKTVQDTLGRMNDFIGYRPVAVLRTSQRIEPYRHEWVSPVPLYVRGAGVAVGRYQKLIERMLAIVAATDPDLLAQAQFDPELLDELAFDPRAYDFDHPANKRPNYHFGQWDPHRIDNQGRYRRFVLQQVTLDALLSRVEQPGELAADELLFEAAAVLCGTMLMASGTSGSGPDAYDSNLSLATLAPRIAAYRDVFYQQLLDQVPGNHGLRLKAEAKSGRQPLAAARQHLNHFLARRRAAQLERVHLAQLFARMGYADAARRQAQVVPVASARMICEIECRLTVGHRAVGAGELEQAAALLAEATDFVERGIECGALVDPWNILGFQGNFSLFPSLENSVTDHRIEQLTALLERVFGLYARLWTEAAARNETTLISRLSKEMRELAGVVDKFASTTVEGVESFSGVDAYDSARRAAEALRAWHQGGAATADIGFWRQHVAHFNSPKAYAMVADSLLDKADLVAAMALVVQWLSLANEISLKQGEYSFQRVSKRWLEQACAAATVADADRPATETLAAADARRALIVKFFDYLEANAEDFWEVPRLELKSAAGRGAAKAKHDEEEPALENEEEGESLYRAAYDDVVYIDSTGDGVDADMLESGTATDYELELEARRIHERLAFLATVAQLWKTAAAQLRPPRAAPLADDVVRRWLDQARRHEEGLLRLLETVERQTIPPPATASRDSLLEYDRRRSVKEALVEDVISAAITSGDAVRLLGALAPAAGTAGAKTTARADSDERALERAYQTAQRHDADAVREMWPQVLAAVRGQTLLYIPQLRGGDPGKIVQARGLQLAIRELLVVLPRLGLLREACQLIEATRLAEAEHLLPGGAVSEFDRQFEVGYRALVEALSAVSLDWPNDPESQSVSSTPPTANELAAADSELVECLEPLTEALLKQWLAHSRNLRLSVLEKISDAEGWKSLVEFIERYGRDLFTQRFLNFGNLRAILHQGVDNWLGRLQEEGDAPFALIDDLDRGIPREQAVRHLELVIEAILENYSEYRDYNSTTTQSDRGELLHTLLDFLRLRVQYDRIAWHLRPVLAAHEVLVRRGRDQAAEMWRRALAERTCEIADTLQRRLAELERKYAMRVPTVADRIAERFVRPLAIDRMRALVRPASEAAGEADPPHAFKLLEQEADELCQVPSGAGLDVPSWLAALEQEMETVQQARGIAKPANSAAIFPQSPISLADVQSQLTDWELESSG